MREHLDTSKPASRSARTATGISEATAPGTPRSTPQPPQDELSQRRNRQALDEILKAAEAAFPGQAPGVKPIREKLGIGQAKAQLIRNHLQALQAAAG